MASCEATVIGNATEITGEISGNFRPAGLTTEGRLTFVTLSSGSWTALPPTPLANRNALSIQNNSGVVIALDYKNTEPTFKGILLANSSERFYSITDSIIMYAKAQSGTPEILIEELA